MGDLPTFGELGPTFRFTSLTASDRNQIVARSGQQLPGYAYVQARLFQLSALGANLDLLGQWSQLTNSNQTGASLAEWRQITTGGRDQFVRVVHYGYMFPLGNPAVIIDVTDRIFVPDEFNTTDYADAYLQFKTFIRVVEPVMTYPAYGQPFDATTWPFEKAEILTLSTPTLDLPGLQGQLGVGPAPIGGQYPQCFFPTVGGSSSQVGSPFVWKLRLTDYGGNFVTVHLPLAFVYAEDHPDDPLNPFTGSDMQEFAEIYNLYGQTTPAPSSLVNVDLPGSPIQYAPEVVVAGSTQSGATTHPTLSMTLGAATASTPTKSGHVPSLNSSGHVTYVSVPTASAPSQSELAARNQPAFYPSLLTSNIRLKAAEQLSRSSLDDSSGPGGVAIVFYPNYTQVGFPSSIEPPDRPHRLFHLSEVLGVPANEGSVYSQLLNPPQLNFPADMVGGIGQPNLLVNALSAAAGSIGGATDLYSEIGSGDWSPSDAANMLNQYFGGLTKGLSNFLGGLPLGPLTGALGPSQNGPIPDGPTDPLGILGGFANDLMIPNMTVTDGPGAGEKTVTYTLTASLTPYPSSSPIFTPSPGGQMIMVATVVVSENGADSFTITGQMDPFTITILEGGGDSSSSDFALIAIDFGDDNQPGLTFSAGNGAKSNFSPNVTTVNFLGILDFVNTLEEYLAGLFGGGLNIDVSPTQIQVTLSLALPAVGCGVFTLDNLALNAGVVVPFLGGETALTIGFCSYEQPFTLTVSCFGGGGYIQLGIGLHSIQSVQASFDFEGQFALGVGPISASVSLTAGFTFSYQVGAGATLGGYLRVCGSVELLGIGVSIEVELSITYDFDTNTITGTGSLEITISLVFFSVSIPISITKSFSGPTLGGPIELGPTTSNPFATDTPTFEDQMPTPHFWLEYCEAFGVVPS
jgi:hypothetical protein